MVPCAPRLAERTLGSMRQTQDPFDIVRVTAVRYVRDYVLWLEFSDGVAGELDLAYHLVGAALEPLRARDEFARVRLGAETIEWPNGADWAPESLHALLQARDSLPPSADHTGSAAIPVHTRDMPDVSRFSESSSACFTLITRARTSTRGAEATRLS